MVSPLSSTIIEVARDWCGDDGRFSVVGGLISPVHDSYKKYKPTVADGHHRIKMCNLAVQDSAWLK